MNFFRKTTIVILVCAICGHLQARTKIAVIADKGLENYADLLTVDLSKQKDLSVIERTEIVRVLKEQEISSANIAESYLKLGNLLKADGLAIIKKYEFQKNEFIVTRLVAVNQGVVLAVLPCPLPLEKPETWLLDISAKFAPYLSKLDITQDKAVPISILNIRAPIDTPEMRLLEKEFTLALAFRLVQEKDLFILERWKMEKLAWEKDLDADTANPFWTGSYLLDGSIELMDKENVKVKVRLRKKDGEEKTIEATGNRQQLAEITEKITAELLKNIGKPQDKIPWDSAKESEQYLKESRWALNSGLFAEALSAADSAWALESKSQDALLMKINAYSCLAYPNNRSIGYIWHNPDLKNMQVKSDSVDHAICAMRLLNDYLLPAIPLKKLEQEDENSWRKVAEIATLNSSLVLFWYYKQNSLVKDIEKTKTLRALIKRAYPEIAKRVFCVYYAEIFQMKAYFLPLWCNTPEETFEECRKLINENYPGSSDSQNALFQMALDGLLARSCIEEGRNSLPPIIDWSGELKKEKLECQWKEFVVNLTVSKNIKEKYYGLYLSAYSYGKTKGNVENKYLLELMKLSQDEMKNIIAGKSDIPVFSGYFGGSFNNCLSDDSKAQLTEYLFRYVKSWLEMSLERKADVITSSRNFDMLFTMWFYLSQSKDMSKVIYDLLMKIKNEIYSIQRPDTSDTINHYLDLSSSKYPDIKVVEKNMLSVSKYWLPILNADNKPLLNHRIVAFAQVGGKMVIFSHSWAWEGKMYIMDPIDLSTKEIEIKDQEKSKKYSLCDISSKYALIIGDNKRLLKYQFDSDKWQSFDVIEKNYDSITVFGDMALLTFTAEEKGVSDSGIIMFNLLDGTSKMIASSRRNPPQSPVDNFRSYKVHNIAEVLPGIFVFEITWEDHVQNLFYTYDSANEAWSSLLSMEKGMLGKIFKRKINFKDGKHVRSLFLTRTGNSLKSMSYAFSQFNDSPKNIPSIDEWETSGTYLCRSISLDLINFYPYVAYEGHRAFYYTESSRNTGYKYLILFYENEKNGYEIQLDFKLSENQKEILFWEKNNPSNSGLWALTPVPSVSKILWMEGHGLFINARDSAFLWFIPQKDIDDYINTITAGSNPELK